VGGNGTFDFVPLVFIFAVARHGGSRPGTGNRGVWPRRSTSGDDGRAGKSHRQGNERTGGQPGQGTQGGAAGVGGQSHSGERREAGGQGNLCDGQDPVTIH